MKSESKYSLSIDYPPTARYQHGLAKSRFKESKDLITQLGRVRIYTLFFSKMLLYVELLKVACEPVLTTDIETHIPYEGRLHVN